MRKVVGISAIILFAGIVGAMAQSQVPQGPADQNGRSQGTPAGVPASPVPKPAESKSRTNLGPPYDACYLKCINSGNPADFCQHNAKSYCS